MKKHAQWLVIIIGCIIVATLVGGRIYGWHKMKESLKIPKLTQEDLYSLDMEEAGRIVDIIVSQSEFGKFLKNHPAIERIQPPRRASGGALCREHDCYEIYYGESGSYQIDITLIVDVINPGVLAVRGKGFSD